MIAVKRVYDPPAPEDGARFLVDRLWPRGISKEKAAIQAWLKPLAPSDMLRKQFHGETAGSDAAWNEFRAAYAAELGTGDPAIAEALATLDAAVDAGPVTLLYAAKDEARNNAVALSEWLASRR